MTSTFGKIIPKDQYESVENVKHTSERIKSVTVLYIRCIYIIGLALPIHFVMVMGQLQDIQFCPCVFQATTSRSFRHDTIPKEQDLSNMADKIIGMREEKLLFDFKIHIKDDFIPCHKFIIALHSPYMKAMLTSDMAEVAKQETRLDHIDMDIVKIILAYMYTEDFSVHKDQLMDVITAADYLHMKELKEMCLKEVPAILEVGNVLEWWKMCGKIDLDTTKEHCEELMATAFVDITKHREFLRLNHAEVTDYFNHICGQSIERDDILKAAIYWADHDATERLEYLDDLLQQIQLDKCSLQGIATVMKSYAALLDQRLILYKVLAVLWPIYVIPQRPPWRSAVNQ